MSATVADALRNAARRELERDSIGAKPYEDLRDRLARGEPVSNAEIDQILEQTGFATQNLATDVEAKKRRYQEAAILENMPLVIADCQAARDEYDEHIKQAATRRAKDEATTIALHEQLNQMIAARERAAEARAFLIRTAPTTAREREIKSAIRAIQQKLETLKIGCGGNAASLEGFDRRKAEGDTEIARLQNELVSLQEAALIP